MSDNVINNNGKTLPTGIGTGGNADGLSGSGDTLNLQAGVYASLNGNHDRINGSNDAIWITGNDDPTFGNSDYVDASGGGDFVDGTGDDDVGSAFYGVPGTDGGGGGGYGGYDGYAGFVRGNPGKPFTGIDVIAQYDQAHGYDQAAQDAKVAFNRALESANGQLATSAATLGDEPPGPKWGGRVITYNFATAPTTGASPISGAIEGRDQAVIKPKPLRPPVEGGFTVDDFNVREEQGTVTCPAAHTVALSRRAIRGRSTTARSGNLI